MRMYLFTFVLFLVLLPGMSMTNAQNKISIEVRKGRLTEVFTAIQDKSPYRFFYSTEDVKEVMVNDVVFIEDALETVLDKVLKGTGMIYLINHKIFFV